MSKIPKELLRDEIPVGTGALNILVAEINEDAMRLNGSIFSKNGDKHTSYNQLRVYIPKSGTDKKRPPG